MIGSGVDVECRKWSAGRPSRRFVLECEATTPQPDSESSARKFTAKTPMQSDRLSQRFSLYHVDYIEFINRYARQWCYSLYLTLTSSIVAAPRLYP
jgi:hypothetical protein